MSAWTIPSYGEWAVPGYTEERPLGHGITGRVVAAVHDATGRRAAIKYLEAVLVRDGAFLGEFRGAAERLGSLDAPHVVRLFDYVEQPGEGAAIVMELIDGVSLREMIRRRGPLGAAAALVMLKDSLLGLAAAHSRRVAHRDVKPDNVLIDAGGWCTLTDFGVAVRADKQLPAAGTPAYMAPELWHGAPNVPVTDLYAATAVFFESLTGKPPFSGRLGQLRRQHETAPLPLDGIDPPLHELVARGLAKNPAERPPGGRSFVRQLDALGAGVYGPAWEDEGRRELAERAAAVLPLLAGGGGSSATATKRATRKVLAFASTAFVVLVALGAAGAVALSKSSNSTQLSSSSVAAITARAAVTPPLASSKCTSATTFAYRGTITATTPGKLTYQWVYSSGKQGPLQALNFTAAGGRQVSGGTVKASKTGGGWAELSVLSPAAQSSNRATYQLLCGTAANSAGTVTGRASAPAQATTPAVRRGSGKASASPSRTIAKPSASAGHPTQTATRPAPSPPISLPSPSVSPPTPTPSTGKATGGATAGGGLASP